MQDLEEEIVIKDPEQMGRKNLDLPDVVLKRKGDDASSDQSAIEGFIGKSGFTFKLPKTSVNTQGAITGIDNALRYYSGNSPDGVKTIDGQVFPASSTEEEPWTISVWTNYGEHKKDYQDPSDWSTFLSDISQQREIDGVKAERAIDYVRIQTPFLRFGFVPGETVKDLMTASTISDTTGLAEMVGSVTEGISSERIGDFFEHLKKASHSEEVKV